MAAKKDSIQIKDISPEAIINQNYTSDIIVISEDKVEIILLKHLEIIKGYHSWSTPAALVISLGITFLTAEFNKSFLTVPPNVWAIIFTCILIISIYWLIRDGIKAMKNSKKRSTNYLINEMKASSSNKKSR